MSTAELRLGGRAEVVARWRSDGFPYPLAIVVCLAVGVGSVVLAPAGLGYDPWSWLIWGHQLDHLTLITRGSESAFKPLAAVLAALVAPAGRAAPQIWLAVSRGGLAMAMALAFHVTRRRHGVAAGVIAAGALLTIRGLSSDLALHGMAEPLQLCFCLAALERGLARRDVAAAAWLVAAALLEVELIAALVLYGVVLVWRSERRPAAAAGIGLAIVLTGLAWTLPGLIAGHSALHAEARAAATPIAGGPRGARHPGLATLREMHTMLLWPLAVGWLGELIVGAVVLARRRVVRPLSVAAAVAALVVLGVALLTQLHHATGTTRFLVASCGVGVVVGVCLWAEVAGRIGAWLADGAPVRGRPALRSARPRAVAAAAVAPLLVLALLAFVEPGVRSWERTVRHEAKPSRDGADVERELPDVIREVGGAGRLLACGPVYTGSLDVPHVAWMLGVPARRIWHGPVRRGGGSIVSQLTSPVVVLRSRKLWPLAGGPTEGTQWQVSSTCL